MQSRCNGTRVSDGFEIRRSATTGEIFAGTWEIDITVRLNMSQLLHAPPPPPPSRKGSVLRVSCQMQHLGLICYWTQVIGSRSLTGPKHLPT